ncbi:MAG: PhzF family phenazine biosynthesis protein [Oscillospiraceae bacterium]|nr:PhzF family phenazine biosynthesis protein [Oscillospiraceae bacterium]
MKYYIADAFTDKIFSGNPAGVCILDSELPAEAMQKIAFENNLSETAFVRRTGDVFSLRWFTPGFEIDLCGHATLAAAHIVMEQLERDMETVRFETVSGEIAVSRKDGLYEMSFPLRKPKKIEVTERISAALGFAPREIYSDRDLYAVMDSEAQVKSYVPDYEKLSSLDEWMGIAVTAKGESCDFVSRFFCPELKLEDPVTGSSHSSLVPLWSEKTGKKEFTAKQLSRRGGTLFCKLCDNSVMISGRAALYLEGEILL